MSLGFVQFGAGRIGAVHAGNVAAHPRARLRWIVDTDRAAAERLAGRHGARAARSAEEALADPSVGAVIVASPTPTHVDLIVAAAHAGKAIFCEKPIDLDLARVDAAIAAVERARVPLFVAFNRRFDPAFAALHASLRAGEVGDLETVHIHSRDPAPPPIEYVRQSGGLFRDMTIHDFDMARWLLGEEPVEVSARASCLVDPAFADAGDVDTALVTLRTQSGKLCAIANSRRAGVYDQRIEVYGSRGSLRAGDASPRFFLERYADAYRAEMNHFVRCVLEGRTPSIGAGDGRAALVLAEAAVESARTGHIVAV